MYRKWGARVCSAIGLRAPCLVPAEERCNKHVAETAGAYIPCLQRQRASWPRRLFGLCRIGESWMENDHGGNGWVSRELRRTHLEITLPLSPPQGHMVGTGDPHVTKRDHEVEELCE